MTEACRALCGVGIASGVAGEVVIFPLCNPTKGDC